MKASAPPSFWGADRAPGRPSRGPAPSPRGHPTSGPAPPLLLYLQGSRLVEKCFQFSENILEKLDTPRRYLVTWYISWSPCAGRAHRLTRFLSEPRKASLLDFVAWLYDHGVPANQQVLRALQEARALVRTVSARGQPAGGGSGRRNWARPQGQAWGCKGCWEPGGWRSWGRAFSDTWPRVTVHLERTLREGQGAGQGQDEGRGRGRLRPDGHMGWPLSLCAGKPTVSSATAEFADCWENLVDHQGSPFMAWEGLDANADRLSLELEGILWVTPHHPRLASLLLHPNTGPVPRPSFPFVFLSLSCSPAVSLLLLPSGSCHPLLSALFPVHLPHFPSCPPSLPPILSFFKVPLLLSQSI